jgi:hypothetical protein
VLNKLPKDVNEAYICCAERLPVYMTNNYKPYYTLLLIIALAVNVIGITTGFFTDDPGLYAALAKNMLYKHDVLQLYTYGQDWLDKPHFPFWAAYASFKLFGVSVWAYRLPALLFFFAGPAVYLPVYPPLLYPANCHNRCFNTDDGAACTAIKR